MTNVIMPKMGDGMEEGTLLEWLKKDGDTVKPGEVIGNIQTDKAVLELESPGKGTLTGFLIGEGETVPVGQPIAAILKDGESLPADWGKGGAASSEAKSEPEPAAVAAKSEPAQASSNGQASASVTQERLKVSPVARKLAEEKGIDLASLTGSGPGGRIVKKDVEEATPGAATMPSAPAVAQLTPAAADQKVKLNRLRGIIADRTQHSFSTVPHFFVTLEVDLEKIHTLREAMKEEDAGKISVNDFVVRACALALQDMPTVNSSFQGDSLLQYGSVNIGIAASIDDGLVVPVIHNAGAMTLRQLAAASKDLVTKARANKLSPAEMQGSTFSISNMGMLNVDVFSAIINEPNAGILAIGTAKKRVVVDEETDEIEIRWKMNITGSFDHRVVDGAMGAQFMNLVRDYLESPLKLIS